MKLGNKPLFSILIILCTTIFIGVNVFCWLLLVESLNVSPIFDNDPVLSKLLAGLLRGGILIIFIFIAHIELRSVFSLKGRLFIYTMLALLLSINVIISLLALSVITNVTGPFLSQDILLPGFIAFVPDLILVLCVVFYRKSVPLFKSGSSIATDFKSYSKQDIEKKFEILESKISYEQRRADYITERNKNDARETVGNDFKNFETLKNLTKAPTIEPKG